MQKEQNWRYQNKYRVGNSNVFIVFIVAENVVDPIATKHIYFLFLQKSNTFKKSFLTDGMKTVTS
jgi:hypothetical protein